MSLFFVLLIVPSFLAQMNNHFVYGSSGIHSEDSELARDAERIKEIFGQRQQMVLLVPDEDAAKEKAMTDAISEFAEIKTVISYSNTVGTQIPPEFLNEEQISIFRSEGKSRIILYADTPDEGKEAFALVEKLRETAEEYYGKNYWLVGQSVINYDLKDTIVKDGPLVSGAAIIAIGLVLLITFRSLTLPLILLITIEGAVWINLGLPYFMNSSLNYIGFLIISSVQLGATVDYGILFAKHYMRNRLSESGKEAARLAIRNTSASIMTPACILAIACLILGFISSNGIISELGLMLGRGAIISSILVLILLPSLLIIFDRVIQKTTLGTCRKKLNEMG